MFNKEQYLQELKEIVEIDCGTCNPSGVKKVVDIFADKFEKMGFKIEKIHLDDRCGPLLIAHNKPELGAYDVAFVGHCDTVYNEVGSVVKYPFKIEQTEQGRKVFGLGTFDMKGGILNAIYAVRTLSKEELDNYSICFILNPDEEIGSIYSKEMIALYAKKAKCALIMESSEKEDGVVNSRKGIATFTVNFKGVSAHASIPSNGVSALQEMAHFILNLQKINNEEQGLTTSVGIAKGGIARNVIPFEASAEIEVRFFKKEHYDEAMLKINNLVSNPVLKGAEIELIQNSHKVAMYNVPENQWIEDLVMNAAKKINLPLNIYFSPGASDGNEISALGVPTMDGLGTIGEFWHNGEKEGIFIDKLENKLNLVIQILKDLKS